MERVLAITILCAAALFSLIYFLQGFDGFVRNTVAESPVLLPQPEVPPPPPVVSVVEPPVVYEPYEPDANYTPQDLFVPIFSAEPLPTHIETLIWGSSFHENTPFGFHALSYLTLTHFGFCGNKKIGHMIVAAEIADEVLEIFEEIFLAEFPIYSIILIDYFEASDTLSMAANNSVGFNFRNVSGTNHLSRHAFGMAVDINPIQNPLVQDGDVRPPAGAAYLDRTDIRPGMIVYGCPVHTAFVSRGWAWGGSWRTLLDFHHFDRR